MKRIGDASHATSGSFAGVVKVDVGQEDPLQPARRRLPLCHSALPEAAGSPAGRLVTRCPRSTGGLFRGSSEGLRNCQRSLPTYLVLATGVRCTRQISSELEVQGRLALATSSPFREASLLS